MAKLKQRESAVMELLKSKGKLHTEEVSSMLGISESSTRRLFLELEKAGKVVRLYGGIQDANGAGKLYSFSELEKKHISEKRDIGVRSACLLQEDDIIYLDSGTTLFQFALAIKERIKSQSLHDIRVITNSMANMEVLADVCEVILIGGMYRPGRKDFAGYASERFVQCFNYKKTFLGADGLDMDEGFMGTDTETARLNEIILPRSAEVYVLLDSSKVGVRSFVSYARTESVTAVVTDDKIAEDRESSCDRKGIHLIKAPRVQFGQ